MYIEGIVFISTRCCYWLLLVRSDMVATFDRVLLYTLWHALNLYANFQLKRSCAQKKLCHEGAQGYNANEAESS